MAALDIEDLKDRYLSSCEERRCEAILPLMSMLEERISFLSQAKQNRDHIIQSILLQGSQAELFNNRVSYNQLDALMSTFVGVCPLHTVDLSYNFIDDTGAKLIAEFLKVSRLHFTSNIDYQLLFQ